MDNYSHRVVAVFRSRATAAQARDQLLTQGSLRAHIRLQECGAGLDRVEARPGTPDVFTDLLRGAALGRAVGVAAGSGVSIVLAAADLSLFIASPVLAALYGQGWGASLGGLVGPLKSMQTNRTDVIRLFRAAWAAGQAVVVVRTKSAAETFLAQQVFSDLIDPPARRAPALKTLQAAGGTR